MKTGIQCNNVNLTCIQWSNVNLTCTCIQWSSANLTCIQWSNVNLTCIQWSNVNLTCIQRSNVTCIRHDFASWKKKTEIYFMKENRFASLKARRSSGVNGAKSCILAVSWHLGWKLENTIFISWI